MGEALRKFSRPGQEVRLRDPTNKKLNHELKRTARYDREALFRLVKGEVLQTEEAGYLEADGRENTAKFSQAQLLEGASVGVAKKRFTFNLPYGPFSCDFTRNGQHLLAGGHKGQLALMHCDTMNILTEVQVKETVRAVKTLHNHTMFAAAQKKYVYIYDQQGLELHCLRDQTYPTHLEFLPYHFLLVTAGERGYLHYRDISTGQQVSSFNTKLGPARCLRQNPRNAVIHAGHSNGTVTLWTPTVQSPVVKMFCHGGSLTSLGIHGSYMVTAGADGFCKVWDLRKYEAIHNLKAYGQAISDLDVSMTGLLAIGFGSQLEIWKGIFDGWSEEWPRRPYLTEEYRGKQVNSVRFRPYEDVLAVGHTAGFAGLVCPGAGYANFDSFEANPFETKKQRREKEVRGLLEKLQPDSIMLDPSRIGSLDKKVVDQYQKEAEEKKKAEEGKKKMKKKQRGANKVGNRLKRKHLQEGAEQRGKTKGRLREEVKGDAEEDSGPEADDDAEGDAAADAKAGADNGATATASAGGDGKAPAGKGTALGRFYGKRRRKT